MFEKINSSKVFKAPLALVVLLFLVMALSACGDPTATSVPPTATPVPPTATPSGPKSVDDIFKSVSGLNAITVDQAIFGDSLKMLPGAAVKMYVSEEESAKLFPKLEAAILAGGYTKFDMPAGAGSLTSTSADGSGGIYVNKGETADMILAAGPVPSDATELTKELNVPGVTPEQAQKLVDQLKGKKTFVAAITTPGVMVGMIKGFASMTTVPSTGATPGATPTK